MRTLPRVLLTGIFRAASGTVTPPLIRPPDTQGAGSQAGLSCSEGSSLRYKNRCPHLCVWGAGGQNNHPGKCPPGDASLDEFSPRWFLTSISGVSRNLGSPSTHTFTALTFMKCLLRRRPLDGLSSSPPPPGIFSCCLSPAEVFPQNNHNHNHKRPFGDLTSTGRFGFPGLQRRDWGGGAAGWVVGRGGGRGARRALGKRPHGPCRGACARPRVSRRVGRAEANGGFSWMGRRQADRRRRGARDTSSGRRGRSGGMDSVRHKHVGPEPRKRGGRTGACVRGRREEGREETGPRTDVAGGCAGGEGAARGPVQITPPGGGGH